jgi:uncharacterized protein YjbI with pentapeptide repeats
MTKQELVELLLAGNVQEFNEFRANNPDIEIDLSGVDFVGFDFYIDLSQVNFKSTNLSNANLYGALLCDADLEGANLRGANLSETDLEGANFQNADCRDVNFNSAKFSFNYMTKRNVCFYGANLEGAIFDHEVIYGSEDCNWLNRAILPSLLGLK